MKYFKLILYVFVSFHNTYAQEYFQQEVNYKINVELDDENHKLIGNINIEYKNNSEDPLDIIWMHLWPNAYKNNSTALVQQMVQENNFDLYYADSCDRGYIHNLNFWYYLKFLSILFGLFGMISSNAREFNYFFV